MRLYLKLTIKQTLEHWASWELTGHYSRLVWDHGPYFCVISLGRNDCGNRAGQETSDNSRYKNMNILDHLEDVALQRRK